MILPSISTQASKPSSTKMPMATKNFQISLKRFFMPQVCS